MDYITAHDKKIEMFKRIKNSIFIDPDTSLWSAACLYDQGIDIALQKLIQAELNSIMFNQMNGNFGDENQGFKNLEKILLSK